MSRAEKKRIYRAAWTEARDAEKDGYCIQMLAFALVGGRPKDYRRGMVLCALLGFSTCTGKPLH